MTWGYYFPVCFRCAPDEELGSNDRAGEKQVSLPRNTCVRGTRALHGDLTVGHPQSHGTVQLI